MYIPVYSFLFHQIYNLPIILEINKNNLLTVPNFIDLYTRENKISEHRGIVNKEASVKRENRYFFFPIPINRWSRGGKKYFRHWRGTWKRSVRNIGWRKDRSDKLWNGGGKKKKVNVRSIVRERRRWTASFFARNFSIIFVWEFEWGRGHANKWRGTNSLMKWRSGWKFRK